MGAVAQHWLVRAIGEVAPSSWSCIVSEPQAVVFALTTTSSESWPTTVTIVPVADEDWPSADDFAAAPDEGNVRLAHATSPGQMVAHVDVQIDGALLDCPLAVDIWFDTTPRLHLAAAGAGADLHELAYFLDSITELADAFATGDDQTVPTDSTLVGRP